MMAEIIPNLWYDNAVKDAPYTLSAGITESPGFQWVNVSDWRDFTEFKWAPLSMSYVEMTLPSAKTMSAFIMWASVVNASLYVLSAELGAPGGGFTSLAGLQVGPSRPVCAPFPAVTVPAGNKIRITRVLISNVPDITHVFRCVFAGTGVTVERGMFNGIQPPLASGSFVSDTVLSVNGSIIGRNVRREDRQMKLDFSPVTAGWVRTSWEPFVAHMQKFACFYQWNPNGPYGTEIVFAGAEQISPPENINLKGYMKVGMTLRCLL